MEALTIYALLGKKPRKDGLSREFLLRIDHLQKLLATQPAHYLALLCIRRRLLRNRNL